MPIEPTNLQFELNGVQVEAPDDGASLLEVLRDRLGVRSPKDGCSPQGQCGCCTVLVDGKPRVSCVTPARRVSGRSIVTLEGLESSTRSEWTGAFCDAGASQCGFCTPGIIMRLEGLRTGGRGVSRPGTPSIGRPQIDRALAAHLCRCTGWNTIVDAATRVLDPGSADTVGDPGSADASVPVRGSDAVTAARDLAAASRRASLEGGAEQVVSLDIAAGHGGFADDGAPADALVAVPDPNGGWVVATTLTEARASAAKIQGRRTTVDPRSPLSVPAGDWDATLVTSWVEPAYVETDASWCEPGGEPASVLANGGAFGAKRHSPLPQVARELADEHGRAVRVLWSREDCVRHGPKRPPIAAGANGDGSGVLVAVRTPGLAAAVAEVAPLFEVVETDVAGPPTSVDLRSAGRAEALVLLAAAGATSQWVSVDDDVVSVQLPEGGRATAAIRSGELDLWVDAGTMLDAVVLRSYCVGAAHMALSWVTSESLAVDDAGTVQDLTVRSFGVLRSQDMVPTRIEIAQSDEPPVAVSDAVFIAVAAAAWRLSGWAPTWPTGVATIQP